MAEGTKAPHTLLTGFVQNHLEDIGGQTRIDWKMFMCNGTRPAGGSRWHDNVWESIPVRFRQVLCIDIHHSAQLDSTLSETWFLPFRSLGSNLTLLLSIQPSNFPSSFEHQPTKNRPTLGQHGGAGASSARPACNISFPLAKPSRQVVFQLPLRQTS